LRLPGPRVSPARLTAAAPCLQSEGMSRLPRRLAAALAIALALALAPCPGRAAREIGLCRFDVDETRAGVADALAETCEERAPRIFEQLGASRDRSGVAAAVTVRIVSSPSEIAGASPPGARPPDWSIAVAYPEPRVVVLALRHRDGRPVEDLDIELEHELSHVALHDATGGAAVPRWLSEGVAVLQSERSSMTRRSALLLASLGGRVRSLAALHDYPDGDTAITLAYAEAADFTGYLIRREGWRGIRVTLHKLARGIPIERALEAAYGRSAGELEKDWRRGLARRPSWAAIAAGSGLTWGVATLLFVAAYFQARRRKARRIVEMEEEELTYDARLVPGGAFRPDAATGPGPADPWGSRSGPTPSSVPPGSPIH
jgi:hypothetical protein